MPRLSPTTYPNVSSYFYQFKIVSLWQGGNSPKAYKNDVFYKKLNRSVLLRNRKTPGAFKSARLQSCEVALGWRLLGCKFGQDSKNARNIGDTAASQQICLKKRHPYIQLS